MKGDMEGQQNPNEPGKPNAPGQQGGGQQEERERQERERQQREREKQGGGWRPRTWWQPTGRTISLVVSEKEAAGVASRRFSFCRSRELPTGSLPRDLLAIRVK